MKISPRLSRGLAGAGVVLLLPLGSCHSGTTRANAHPGATIVAYGDSLLYEARTTIEALARADSRVAVKVRATPGFSPCDWLGKLKTDLRQLHPAVVMLEVAGNSWTSCMGDASGRLLVIGSDGYYRKYAVDLRAFFRAAEQARVKIVFVAPPPVAEQGLQRALTRLELIARDAGAGIAGFQIEMGPRDAVTSDGHFTRELPCLAVETRAEGCGADKLIAVREPAGLHFCPGGYAETDAVFRGCGSYSSGAVRYGRAMFDAAVSDLGRGASS